MQIESTTSSGHLVKSSGHYEKLKNTVFKIQATGKTDKNLIQGTTLKLFANSYLTIKSLGIENKMRLNRCLILSIS